MDRTSWVDEYNKNNNNEYANYVFYGHYLAMHIPGHRLASKDGYVYIHRLQAEKKLGRHLNKGECVHHIDGNKFNNDLEKFDGIQDQLRPRCFS